VTKVLLHYPLKTLYHIISSYHAGSRGFWGQLQAVTEDVFICAVQCVQRII